METLSKSADKILVLIPYKHQKSRGAPEAGKASAQHRFQAGKLRR